MSLYKRLSVSQECFLRRVDSLILLSFYDNSATVMVVKVAKKIDSKKTSERVSIAQFTETSRDQNELANKLQPRFLKQQEKMGTNI